MNNSQFSKYEKYVYPLLLLLIGTVMLIISWQKWADVLIDYGREVYVPWRIINGDILYKDLAFLWGPLSPYLNALLFKFFGASVMTLAVFNIGIIAAIVFFIYQFLKFTTDKNTAFIGGVIFLTIFAFGRIQNGQGGHNYICPYTYSMTYGMFLSFWAIDTFRRFICQTTRWGFLWGAGFLIGLTSLTRFEIFIPLLAAIIVGFAAVGRVCRWGVCQHMGYAAVLAAGIMLPILSATFCFSFYMPIQKVLPYMFSYNPQWKELLSLSYYRNQLGVDLLPYNLEKIFLHIGGCIMAVLGAVLSAAGIANIKENKKIQGCASVLLGLGVLVVCILTIFSSYTYQIARVFPFVSLIMALFMIRKIYENKTGQEKGLEHVMIATVAVLAFFMPMRKIFRVLFMGAGFVHALPAAIICLIFFLRVLPAWIGSQNGQTVLVRNIFSILIVCVCTYFALETTGVYAKMKRTVGEQGNLMYIFDQKDLPKGDIVNDFLASAQKIIPPDENMLVFPEGAMLNFLTGRVSPLAYNTLMPAELFSFGEFRVLKSMFMDPPDNIVFISRDMWEFYRYRNVGDDYAKGIVDWVKDNYVLAWHSGGNAFDGEQFGIEVYKHKGKVKQ